MSAFWCSPKLPSRFLQPEVCQQHAEVETLIKQASQALASTGALADDGRGGQTPVFDDPLVIDDLVFVF